MDRKENYHSNDSFLFGPPPFISIIISISFILFILGQDLGHEFVDTRPDLVQVLLQKRTKPADHLDLVLDPKGLDPVHGPDPFPKDLDPIDPDLGLDLDLRDQGRNLKYLGIVKKGEEKNGKKKKLKRKKKKKLRLMKEKIWMIHRASI